jgi:hypothetical protein
MAAHGETFAVRIPADRADHVFHRPTGVQLASKRVPNLIQAIFATADNQFIGNIPVDTQDNPIMGIPLQIFPAGLHCLYHQSLSVRNEYLIIIRPPTNAVN